MTEAVHHHLEAFIRMCQENGLLLVVRPVSEGQRDRLKSYPWSLGRAEPVIARNGLQEVATKQENGK